MKFVVDHDLHIHSRLSNCAAIYTEQTPQRILQHAKDHNLKHICLTDHYWDDAVPGASTWYQVQNFPHVIESKPLPQAEGICFHFGCECEMTKENTLALPPERYDDFEFIIIPTTHMHMRKYTIPLEEEHNLEGRVPLWINRLDALLDMDLPFHKFGVAHLASEGIWHFDSETDRTYLKILDAIPDSELVRLFTKAAKVGIGIELNYSDMCAGTQLEKGESVMRIFRIAKRCGCKFYCGSDAHSPATFAEYLPVMEKAVEMLNLTEEDKFIPKY